MARIPTYESTALIRPIQPIQIQSPLVELGSSIAKMGETGLRLANDFQERRMKLDVINALAGLDDEERKYLQEARLKEGTEAFGVVDKAAKFYDDQIEKIASKFGDERAAMLFKERAIQKKATGLDVLAKHEAEQYKKSVEDTVRGLTQRLELSANVYAGDDEKFEENWNLYKEAVQELHPGRDVSAHLIQARQNYLRSRIINVMETDPEHANSLLERYQEEMDPAAKATIQRSLKSSLEEKKLTEAYEVVIGKYGNDLSRAILDLRKPSVMRELGLNLKEATQLSSTLKQEWTFIKAQQHEAERQAREASLNKYAPLLFSEDLDYQQVYKQISQDKGLKPEDKVHFITALESRAKAKRKAEADIEEFSNLANILYNIHTGGYKDSMDVFADAVGKLKDWKHVQQALQLWKDYEKESPGGKLNYYKQAVEMAENIFKESISTKEEQARKKYEFQLSLDLAMRKHNLKATDPQVYDLAEQLLAPQGRKKFLSIGIGRQTYAFESPVQKELAGIPPEIRSQIVTELVKANAPVTERNIQAVYERKFLQKPGHSALGAMPPIPEELQYPGLVSKPMPLLEEEE